MSNTAQSLVFLLVWAGIAWLGSLGFTAYYCLEDDDGRWPFVWFCVSSLAVGGLITAIVLLA